MTELDGFRADKDAFFREHPQSPLAREERASFAGLSYFPESEALVIEAELDTDVDRDEIGVMETTAGGEQAYRRAGKVRFEVDGEPAELTLYASERQWELPSPFGTRPRGRRPTAPVAISRSSRRERADA